MKYANTSMLIVVSLALVALPSFAAEQPGISSNTAPRVDDGGGSTLMNSKTDGCNLIDFEGIENNAVIGLVPGPVNVTFGASWLGLIDQDAGGSGNFANEPSPSTAAYFLDLNDISISLNPPVQFVEFFYTAAAASLPVTVVAYDANNGVVDQAVGNVLGTDVEGANCTGDPNGNYCLWGSITLTAGADNITSIQITGPGVNAFAIDNLQFCTEPQDLVSCCLDDLSCQQLSAEGCAAAGGVEVPTCEGVDCEPVSTEKSTWGSIKGTYR